MQITDVISGSLQLSFNNTSLHIPYIKKILYCFEIYTHTADYMDFNMLVIYRIKVLFKKNLRGFGPLANYADRATAATFNIFLCTCCISLTSQTWLGYILSGIIFLHCIWHEYRKATITHTVSTYSTK
jgi:hypothetical protein